MRRAFAVLLPLVALAAAAVSCSGPHSPATPTAVDADSLQSVSASARGGGEKEFVCHYDRSLDTSSPLEVSISSVAKHQEHGDWIVTDEVCGDQIDNDCDGAVDGGCLVECPCFAAEDFASVDWACAGAVIQCEDFALSNGDYVSLDLACTNTTESFLAYAGPYSESAWVCSDTGPSGNVFITAEQSDVCLGLLRSAIVAVGCQT